VGGRGRGQGGKEGGRGKGGEMTQTLYSRMNKRNKKIDDVLLTIPSV
jgi:hypothetical protein